MGCLALASLLALSRSLTACFSSSGDKQLNDASLSYTFTYPGDYKRGAAPGPDSRLSKNFVVLHKNGERSAASISVQPSVFATTLGTHSVTRALKLLKETSGSVGHVASSRTYTVNGYDFGTVESSLGSAGVSLTVIDNG